MRFIVTLCAAAAIGLSLGAIASEAEAKERSCTGELSIFVGPNQLLIRRFSATAFDPGANGARRKARDRLFACVRAHAAQPRRTPPECSLVVKYGQFDLYETSRRAVCSTLGVGHYQHSAVHLRSFGDKGCGPRRKKEMSEVVRTFPITCNRGDPY
ncbi:MAG: hypothetical protein AAGM38_10705 [Pseudomonadota bacterium]